MISLKRYLEQNPEKLLRQTVDAYRAALTATAESGLRCCPSTAEALRKSISEATEALKTAPAKGTLGPIQQQVLKAIQVWGQQSEAYFKQKAADVKEILTELSSTADSFCKRDQRYSRQFQEITVNLRAIAKLEDLTKIRASLLHSAGELKGCVERMTREGNESVASLKTSLDSYRDQLEKAQELASLDSLTGLLNRREVEARIAARVSRCVPFCLVIIDIDNFKQINDRHGHLAGDEMLRQIASELRLASRAEDTIGRWGGDEFILLLDGSFTNTKVKVERMRPWIFGNYEIELSGSKLGIVIGASIGVAEWHPGETMLQVLSRADAEMYREKGTHK